jgi:hypothetical protein
MFVNILPVDEPMGLAFFRAAITETINQEKMREERDLFRLADNTDYVAHLLLHSALFGFEHHLGIWGGGIMPGSEIDGIAERIANGKIDDAHAQSVADQLLLQFGFFSEKIWDLERLRLERCGSEFYRKAARVQLSPIATQLESMADNFIPWTEVLHDMQRRERLFLS